MTTYDQHLKNTIELIDKEMLHHEKALKKCKERLRIIKLGSIVGQGSPSEVEGVPKDLDKLYPELKEFLLKETK